jgi:hypothetical protein
MKTIPLPEIRKGDYYLLGESLVDCLGESLIVAVWHEGYILGKQGKRVHTIYRLMENKEREFTQFID